MKNLMTTNDLKAWDNHYSRNKSALSYADENLVRMLKSFLVNRKDRSRLTAVDLGCGSGRHLALLCDQGIESVIGMDYSFNALGLCKKNYPFPLVLGNNDNLPVKSGFADIVVAWGSLHYCKKDASFNAFREIFRIMKKGALLFGTLRSDRDSYLKRGRNIGDETWITDLRDINNSIVSFYNEDELKNFLGMFNKFQFGFMERSIIGDTSKRISHWFFWAEK